LSCYCFWLLSVLFVGRPTPDPPQAHHPKCPAARATPPVVVQQEFQLRARCYEVEMMHERAHHRWQICGRWSLAEPGARTRRRPPTARPQANEVAAAANHANDNDYSAGCCHETLLGRLAASSRLAAAGEQQQWPAKVNARLADNRISSNNNRRRTRMSGRSQAKQESAPASTQAYYANNRAPLKPTSVQAGAGSRERGSRQQQVSAATRKLALGLLLCLASAIPLASSNNTPPTPQTVEGEYHCAMTGRAGQVCVRVCVERDSGASGRRRHDAPLDAAQGASGRAIHAEGRACPVRYRLMRLIVGANSTTDKAAGPCILMAGRPVRRTTRPAGCPCAPNENMRIIGFGQR
jgi:hypothetical protein